MRSHISHAQRCTVVELVFDGEVPFLHRRRLGVGLHSLRRKGRAGLREPGPQDGAGGTPGVTGSTEGRARSNKTPNR